MPLVPVTQPAQVTPGGGFDYVTVDAQRRRVYAAHPGGGGLLVADADTGDVLGIVNVGPMAGVAVDPSNGHVYTGNGDAKSISEVDPSTMSIVRSVVVDGNVDAIAFDPDRQRIYADEDDGTRMFVIDTKTFTLLATVALPGHKPEYLQVDPQTHRVYQNIASDSEIAVIDPATLKVSRVFKTPQLTNNHPLQLDATHRVLIAGGENNVLAVYALDGKLLATSKLPTRVDQCNFEPSRGWLACAGGGALTLYSFDGSHAPTLLDSRPVDAGAHTTAIDAQSGTIWLVWGSREDPSAASIQGFTYKAP